MWLRLSAILILLVIYKASALEVEYIVTVEKPESHKAHVEINLKDVGGDVTLCLDNHHGYYPIPISNFTANAGTVNHYFEGEGEWKKEMWNIHGAYSDLKVTYDVKIGIVMQFGHLGYLGRDFGVAMGEWFLLSPIKSVESIRVKFNLPEGWKAYAPWEYNDGYFIPNPGSTCPSLLSHSGSLRVTARLLVKQT